MFWLIWFAVKLLLAMSLLTTLFVPWQFTQSGNYPRFASGAELRTTLVRDREQWTRIAREVGMVAD